VASLQYGADAPAPTTISEGIDLEHLSFAYPGTTRLVLEDVSLRLKPGSVIAIVGENGAGKTTLVKLLCRLYQPSSGRILVDGVDLARIAPEAWRSRLAGAFQDFFRFEFSALTSVGVGDLPLHQDESAVKAAVSYAGADDVVDRLAHGLQTQLGPTWPEGVEISFGQWQKLALARGFMRGQPLLMILDEPTAALDAETEHALFERFATAARERTSDGCVTILVSHRFSTVRMADFIVVLDGAHLVESGSHEELMAKGGQYAELYGMQAAAYR
jgi:ATP-binding cassette subfamily B protein